MLGTSATLQLLIRSFISSGIGIGQTDSPASPATVQSASRISSVPMIAATLSPSATTMWPVSVATSRITSGLLSAAITSASAMISRPSASVLVTSTVVPPYIVSTSPGRIAAPEIMFSAIGAYVVTAIGSPSWAMTKVACTTAAAPAMSYFMCSIEGGGLIV